jgi:hypothetical protein
VAPVVARAAVPVEAQAAVPVEAQAVAPIEAPVKNPAPAIAPIPAPVDDRALINNIGGGGGGGGINNLNITLHALIVGCRSSGISDEQMATLIATMINRRT